MAASIGRAERTAQLELVGAVLSVKPDGDGLTSMIRPEGSAVGMSTVIV